MNDELLKKESRDWWNANPMTYNWDGQIVVEEGSPDFYRQMDRRLCEAIPELHTAYFPYEMLLRPIHLEGKKVLVVGMGAGVEVAAFASRGADVTGVDITPKSVELTRRRLELMRLEAQIEVGDAEFLRFAPETFDIVWSWGVLHHTPDTQKAIDEIYRILRPGRQACVMLYHKKSIGYWLHLILFRGILQGQLLYRSRQEILNRYTDGSLAKYYSRRDARYLFRQFHGVNIRTFSQLGEIYPLPRKLRHVVYMSMPYGLTVWLKRKFGGFLYIEAVK